MENITNECFRLPACRTIANGNSLNLISVYHPLQGFRGLSYLIAWWMRIDNLVMKEVTLFVKASNLTSVGKTGVEGEDTLLTEWGREEKLAEVLGKDFDSLFVGTLLTQGSKFVFNARIDKTFEGIFNGLADEGLTDSVSTYKLSGEACDTFFTVNRDAYTQDALCLPTTHSKQTVAIATAERFGEVEVISKLLRLVGILHLLDDL